MFLTMFSPFRVQDINAYISLKNMTIVHIEYAVRRSEGVVKKNVQ